MAEHEMNEAEQTATEAANRILGRLIRRRSRQRQSSVHYFEARDQRRFCWTPWKDSNGNYFTWVLKPYGRGAKSGNAKQWKTVGKIVRSRTRKTARKRAETRYNNWLAYLRQDWRND